MLWSCDLNGGEVIAPLIPPLLCPRQGKRRRGIGLRRPYRLGDDVGTVATSIAAARQWPSGRDDGEEREHDC